MTEDDTNDAIDELVKDSVIRIERPLLPSRTASNSMVWAGSNRSSSSVAQCLDETVSRFRSHGSQGLLRFASRANTRLEAARLSRADVHLTGSRSCIVIVVLAGNMEGA